MAQLNTQVSALLNLGADAMDNLFDVHITLPSAVLNASSTKGEALGANMGLRCLGFTPPKLSLKTYDSPYKTLKVKRPAGRIEGDRSFQLQFRLDAYYMVYRTLLAWKASLVQASTGFASNDLFSNSTGTDKDDSLGTIQVVAADTPPSQQPGKGYTATGITEGMLTTNQLPSSGVRSTLSWTFDHVWIMDMDNPKFVTGSGEIQLVSVTFGFIEYEDSQLYDVKKLTTNSEQRIIPQYVSPDYLQ